SVAPAFAVPVVVPPGQAYGRARHGSDPFLAAGKSEPFAGGRLHGDARGAKTGDLGDARAHGVAVWPDFRALANQGDIEMGDASAARGDAIDCVFQEAVRCGALPPRIARREVRTDVAVGQRAEDRVD